MIQPEITPQSLIQKSPEHASENPELQLHRYKQIFEETCKDVPSSPLPVPRLKDMDTSDRDAPIQVALDGITGKRAESSRILVYEEGEVIQDLQRWQASCRQKIVDREDLDPTTKEKYLQCLDTMIYFGDRELLQGTQVLAKRLITYALAGKDVFFLNENFSGASFEYISLNILEQLSILLQRFPEDMQKFLREKIRSYNYKILGDVFHEKLQQDLDLAGSAILVSADDWRISGSQVISTVSNFSFHVNRLSSHQSFSGNKTNIEMELFFLFEASNRQEQAKNPSQPPWADSRRLEQGESYIDTDLQTSVFSGFTGEWIGSNAQAMSGTWSVVDFGFQSRSGLLSQIQELIKAEQPLAMRLLRKTSAVPSWTQHTQSPYQDQQLRARYRKTFQEWSPLPTPQITPKNQEQAVRNELIFDAAVAGKLGVEKLKSADELQIYLDYLSESSEFITQVVAKILQKLPRKKYKTILSFWERDAGSFDDELYRWFMSEVAEALIPLCDNNRLKKENILVTVARSHLGLDRVIRRVIKKISVAEASAESRDRVEKVPAEIGPLDLSKYTQVVGEEPLKFSREKSGKYYEVKLEDIGSEIHHALHMIFKKKNDQVVCAVIFDKEEEHFPQNSEFNRDIFFDVHFSHSRGTKLSRVDIRYHAPESVIPAVEEVAKLLDRLKFGDQYEYVWSSLQHTYTKDFYLTPQEVLNADEILKKWIAKSREIGERTFLRKEVTRILEDIFGRWKEYFEQKMGSLNEDEVWKVFQERSSYLKNEVDDDADNDLDTLSYVKRWEPASLEWAKKYAVQKFLRMRAKKMAKT